MKTWKVLAGATLCVAALGWTQAAQEADIELEGTVSALNGTTIELFGGLIQVDAFVAAIDSDDDGVTRVDELRVGMAIEVEGRMGASGLIQASEIEVSDEADASSEIAGTVTAVDPDARTFTLGSVEVVWTSRTIFRGLSIPEIGQEVEALIDFSTGRLVAVRVELED